MGDGADGDRADGDGVDGDGADGDRAMNRGNGRGQVTRLLRQVQDDPSAWSRLMPLVYDELHAIARGRLTGRAPGRTLQATALVSEAYLRLSDAELPWRDRVHFYSAAARSMRNILVDDARRSMRKKRGGDHRRVTLSGQAAPSAPQLLDVLSLDDAMTRLEGDHPREHQVVMLRYFAGLANQEVALALEISLATVERAWSFARAWLHRDLTRGCTSTNGAQL